MAVVAVVSVLVEYDVTTEVSVVTVVAIDVTVVTVPVVAVVLIMSQHIGLWRHTSG